MVMQVGPSTTLVHGFIWSRPRGAFYPANNLVACMASRMAGMASSDDSSHPGQLSFSFCFVWRLFETGLVTFDAGRGAAGKRVRLPGGSTFEKWPRNLVWHVLSSPHPAPDRFQPTSPCCMSGSHAWPAWLPRRLTELTAYGNFIIVLSTFGATTTRCSCEQKIPASFSLSVLSASHLLSDDGLHTTTNII